MVIAAIAILLIQNVIHVFTSFHISISIFAKNHTKAIEILPPQRIFIKLTFDLNDGGAAHANADGQSSQTGLGTSCLHLMQQSYQMAASGSSYGMAQSE